MLAVPPVVQDNEIQIEEHFEQRLWRPKEICSESEENLSSTSGRHRKKTLNDPEGIRPSILNLKTNIYLEFFCKLSLAQT